MTDLDTLEASGILKCDTPWGKEFIILGGNGATETVKVIWVNPGQRLTLQSHEWRLEQWTILSSNGGTVNIETPSGAMLDYAAQQGAVHRVPKNIRHRLAAPLTHPLVVLEVAFGLFDQNDITRYEDNDGRAG
ncbi:hypothetical protein A3A38_04200 [Candidatus Kaiserbacteria bacterium RIFCSPLOWO2_01_FULL_53_17]|uniref:Mannose-6-phosphate isomerase type II C-terminal domain-containing protein n=1 Tax=Candidatus Kaiserbacteria bacterium RIFCSPLOWO2_01_FULL_53_17 TaxID=1798511 RepID=A0A1F6EH21_9BACT|nr:MAG: hypothetical protein A3A38_04200 [Candidatus Kaiserbacteria bacterium RIFCSPLOWO2_01_FULL_53_17]